MRNMTAGGRIMPFFRAVITLISGLFKMEMEKFFSLAASAN